MKPARKKKFKKKSQFDQGKELGLHLAFEFVYAEVGAFETVSQIIDRFRQFVKKESNVMEV